MASGSKGMGAIIPNVLTASNLLLGFFSIVSTLHNRYDLAAMFVVGAAVADTLDGRAARYFNVSSDFGKELDSLCDLGSFGVAPAALAYSFLLADLGWMGAFAAAFFAVCGAMRLARFNVNTTKVKGYFMGLPIPAGGCLVSTFAMLGVKPAPWTFGLAVAIVGYLMISTIHYPDFKGQGEPVNKVAAILAFAGGAWCLFVNPKSYLFAPFFGYALLGVISFFLRLVIPGRSDPKPDGSL